MNFTDPRTGDTPLLLAMANEYGDMMELLLLGKANPNLVDGLSGNTPLMDAIYEEHWPAVPLLMAHGADADLANPINGKTARLIAQNQWGGAVSSPMLMHRISLHEDLDYGLAPAPPGPGMTDGQQYARPLPGAVIRCDTDGSDIYPTTLEAHSELHPTALDRAIGNVSAQTDPTGALSPYLLPVLSGPWHTD